MPRAEVLSKQALHTLKRLHGELAGKIESNRKSGDKLRAQMVQVEAVMKMLDPDVKETGGGITMKLKRGTFSAFFLACIAALELEGVAVGKI